MKSKSWPVVLVCAFLFCVAPASALAGSISGEVTDAVTGQPVGGGMVCAGGELGSNCSFALASGEYEIDDLAAGEYRVSFRGPYQSNYLEEYYGGARIREDATPVQLEADEAATGIDAQLDEGAEVTGTVVGEGEIGPLEEIEVCAHTVEHVNYCEQTDSDGQYAIHAIPAGFYTLIFEDWSERGYATRYYDEKPFEDEADEVDLEEGQQFTADATMGPAGGIEGTVTEAGIPIDYANVCYYTPAEYEIGCTMADHEGRYEIHGLPVGPYILEVEDFGELLGFSGGAASFEDATPVAVEAGSMAVEDFEFAGAPGIAGTVTDAVTGEPLEGVGACAYPKNSAGGTSCVYSNWNGEYLISELDPAEYVVEFEDDAYVKQYYPGVADEIEATRVAVSDSLVTGIDAEMQPAGSISGHVTLAGAGTPLSSVEVCALDGNGDSVECRFSKSGTGAYEVGSLPPGEYRVEFFRGGYGTQYFDGKVELEEADPVTVNPRATTTGIDAAMVAKPKNTAKPQLSGVAEVGEVLSCSQGTWSGDPTLYEYFWIRNGFEIEGAEEPSYTVVPADAGKTIRCGVVAENSAGWTFAESASSLKIPSARQLSVTKTGSGSGAVISDPTGIDCGSTCGVGAYQGDEITLTATPAAHSEFTGWSGGGCSGTGNCEVTLGSSDTTVTASFEQILHSVSISVSGAGKVSAVGGFECTAAGGSCSANLPQGSEVVFTATPDPHQELTGWTGCTTSDGNQCTVTVDGAESVNATFAQVTHGVTVAKTGDGSGTVASSPTGIECGSICAAEFDEGATLTLTTVPAADSEFTGWSGACSGSGACEVTVAGVTSVTAGFAKKPSGGGDTQPPVTPGTPSVTSGTPPVTSAPPAPKPNAKPKPVKCKKGFKKKRSLGKTRCVKVKKKQKKRG